MLVTMLRHTLVFSAWIMNGEKLVQRCSNIRTHIARLRILFTLFVTFVYIHTHTVYSCIIKGPFSYVYTALSQCNGKTWASIFQEAISESCYIMDVLRLRIATCVWRAKCSLMDSSFQSPMLLQSTHKSLWVHSRHSASEEERVRERCNSF